MLNQFHKLWIGLSVLVLCTPLGLLAQGTAWGEWSLEDISEMIGFIPNGMIKWSDLWSFTLAPDYSVPGLKGGIMGDAAGYIISACIGITLINLTINFIGKYYINKPTLKV